MSRNHQIWLVTTDEFRAELLQELPGGVRPIFLPSFRRWLRLKRTRLPGLDWAYYYWWQWKVYWVARKLHKEIRFDLAHHVTFGSWRAPTFLFLLPIPLIWGPLGGGETIPSPLRGELGFKGRIFEVARDLASSVSRYDPAIRLVMRKAALILIANQDTARVIPLRYCHKVRRLMGIGMSGAEKMELDANLKELGSGITILFAAVLEPRKGGTLALKAFERLTKIVSDVTLVVIGEGEEESRLKALANSVGIMSRVRFLGGLPRSKVLAWMQATQIFLLPSLRDSAGFVFLEAMASGKPVVCLDLGGPGEIVTEECGFKVHARNSAQVVEDLVTALKKLADSPELRQIKGDAGRRRVQSEFNWKRKGEQMLRYYAELASPERCQR